MRVSRRLVVAAIAMATLGFAAAVASLTSASAETAPLVTFTGGCGARAQSQADADAVTVPAAGRVLFVNRLNYPAVLMIDDRSTVTVPTGDLVPVVFHRGPVTVRLVPPCLTAMAAAPVDVVVLASPAAFSQGSQTGEIAASPRPQPRRASPILVFMAVICVVGATVATIRAIIAERAIVTLSS